MKLVPLTASAPVEPLVSQLAPGFFGREEEARAFLQANIDFLERVPGTASFVGYVKGAAVATGSFKAAPDAEGRLEIAYMTFPAAEGAGHATAMIGALAEMARSDGMRGLLAHTLPQDNASNRALRRNGFTFAGEHMDDEDGPVWRWTKALA